MINILSSRNFVHQSFGIHDTKQTLDERAIIIVFHIREIFDDKDCLMNNINQRYKENFICIDDSDIIKYSRKFGTTIYEIATQDRDFVSEFKDANEERQKKLKIPYQSFTGLSWPYWALKKSG